MDMCVDMCMGTCVGVCVGICVAMCTHTGMDMCANMRLGMFIDLRH